MKKNKSRTLVLLVTVLLWVGLAQAQESANSTSGNATGSGGTVTYSVGQVVYTTNTGSSGSVSQGVQHAYEIFTLGIKETKMKILITAFPNPTIGKLTLQINDYSDEELRFQLFDINGKLINSGQITTKFTQLNMSGLPSATYFVNVLNREKKQFQSFKIIKN